MDPVGRLNALRRWSETAAVVLLAVLAVRAVLAVVGLLVEGGTTTSGPAGWLVFVARPVDTAAALAFAVLLVAVTLGEPTPRARTLAVAGTVVLGVGVLVAVAVLVVEASQRSADGVAGPVDGLLGLVVPVVAMLTAVRVWRLLPQTRAEDPVAPQAALEPPTPVPDPMTAPSYPPDEAAGAVWTSAGAAASGAPASAWGAGDAGGWSAPPDPADPPPSRHPWFGDHDDPSPPDTAP